MKADRAEVQGRESGASLLLTLVVIAGIVILFVILARVVMVERRVSRGYSELQRADMAAQAGAADANNLLLYLFANFPDAATYWDPKISDNAETPGTVYLFQQRPKVAGKNQINMSNATAPQIYARPLVSASLTKPWANYKDALPASLLADPAKYMDFNAPKTFGGAEPTGWIGAMPGATPAPVKVPWVEILEDPAKAKDMSIDPATGRPKNPALARYAFWIDDESFKLNINAAKAGPRGSVDDETKQVGDEKLGDARASLKGGFVRSENQTIAESVAESVVKARDDLQVTGGRLLTPRQVGHATEAPSDTTLANFGRDYKFLLTTQSSGLDLSRSGAKRLDLNKVVEESLKDAGDISYGSGRNGPDLFEARTTIPDAIQRIKKAIEANAPRFGQRFYRPTAFNLNASSSSPDGNKNNGTTVSAADADRYLLKLATNIYDFIGPAVNPTLLDKQGKIMMAVSDTQPLASLDELDIDYDPSGENPVWAMGKKNIPCLTEYAWSVRSLYSKKYDPMQADFTTAIYEFVVDHYFEFWNMGKDTLDPAAGDLGPEPYIVLEDQPYITTNDFDGKNTNDAGEGRNFKIKLTDDFLVNGVAQKIVFPPNEAVVITTDPEWANWTGQNNLNGKKVYVATALYEPDHPNPDASDLASRVDQGISSKPFNNPSFLPVKVPNVRHYRMNSTDYRGGAGSGDYGEVQIGPNMAGAFLSKYFMGNKYGLLDAALSLPLRRYQAKNLLNVPDNNNGEVAVGVSISPFSGGQVGTSEMGNWDPRTKLDVLDIALEGENSNGNYSTLAAKTVQLGSLASIGATQMWVSDKTNGDPVAFVPGRTLRNIAELGLVAEPALIPTWSAAERVKRRTGGRTLTIGQADPYWDGTRNSSVSAAELTLQTTGSREWTAWRLADIFTARQDEDRRGEAKAEVEGLYNPNGILRDGGVVLRALLEGIRFDEATASDPAMAGQIFSTANTADGTQGVSGSLAQTTTPGGITVARYLAQRLSRQFANRFSPIWEPGEISQLQMFSPYGNTTTTTKAQILSGTDVTALNDRGREEITRRLADLITAKGNTYSIYVVGQSLDRKGNPTATKAQKITVRLRPVWDDQKDDTFNPATETDARFSLPDRWKLEILSLENA